VLDRIERPRSDRRVALGLARDLLDGHLDPRVGGRQHRVVDLADRQRGVDERPRVARELHDAAPALGEVPPRSGAPVRPRGDGVARIVRRVEPERRDVPAVVRPERRHDRLGDAPEGDRPAVGAGSGAVVAHGDTSAPCRRATYSAAQVRSAVVRG